MIRRPPRSTLDRSSAASDVYKRQRVLTEPDFGAAYVKTLRLAGGAELGAGLSEAGVDDSCADAARRMPGATRVRRNIFIRDTTLYGGNDAIDDNFLRFALQTHRSDELRLE